LFALFGSMDLLLTSAPFFLLLITVGGTVHLEEQRRRPEDGDLADNAPIDITREHQQWRAAVYHRLGATSATIHDVRTHELQKFAEVERRLKRIERLVQLISVAPARILPGAPGRGRPALPQNIRVGNPDQGQDRRPAKLSQNPRTFAALWDEYVNGINGNKPARDITGPERTGRTRFVYYKRRAFWECMCRLLSNGLTQESAINRIRSVYERYGSLTKQLAAITKDENAGGHNRLFPGPARTRRRSRV
jgi:hypothetical protein